MSNFIKDISFAVESFHAYGLIDQGKEMINMGAKWPKM
jgi:hypothetical protein